MTDLTLITWQFQYLWLPSAVLESVSIEEEWKYIKDPVTKVTEEVVIKKTKKNEEWFDDECLEAVQKKNSQQLKMLQKETRSAREQYRKSRRKASKLCHEYKRKWVRKQVEEMREKEEAVSYTHLDVYKRQ